MSQRCQSKKKKISLHVDSVPNGTFTCPKMSHPVVFLSTCPLFGPVATAADEDFHMTAPLIGLRGAPNAPLHWTSDLSNSPSINDL